MDMVNADTFTNNWFLEVVLDSILHCGMYKDLYIKMYNVSPYAPD